jgi:GT2 family glycosyltransferase
VTTAHPSLDVVTVNFHSAPLLASTADLVRGFAGPAARMFVVDNSPGDGGAEIVRSRDPGATVIQNAVNRGFAAAVNQGLAVGAGELVLLLNPDVERVSGRYADVVAVFRDPSVGAVVPRLLDPDGSLRPSCIREPTPFDLISEDLDLVGRFPSWQRPRRYRYLDWGETDSRDVDAGTGACLFIRRAAFDDVGLLDERFFVYYEETDWLVRAKRRGWRTVFLPTVEAVHRSAGSSPDVVSAHDLLLLESQHRYARKHFGAARAAALRLVLITLDAARLARHALTGRAGARRTALERIRIHLTTHGPRPS